MQCQKTHTFWNSFSKTYMYYVPIRLNDLYLPSKFYMDRTFEVFLSFLLSIVTTYWALTGMFGRYSSCSTSFTTTAFMLGCLSTVNKKSHSMTTEIHVTSTSNVYLNKQKNFVFAFWELSFLHLQKFKINVILIKIHLRIPLKKFIKNLHFFKNWNVLQK